MTFNQTKLDFIKKLHEQHESKSKRLFFSNEKLEEIKLLIRNAKAKSTSKTAKEYDYLKRYDLLQFENSTKLIAKKKSKDDPTLYYVPYEDYYDIINEAHISTSHGGINKTSKELNKKYANISIEAINEFITNCEQCQIKRQKHEIKSPASKSIVSTELNNRCQVDIIDFNELRDGDYKYILHYQDHFTKFSFLRALTSKRASELASNLHDIFLTIGPPQILQFLNGKEYKTQIIDEMKIVWPHLKIVYGRLNVSQSQGGSDAGDVDLKEMLKCWMKTHDSKRWSIGLKFVQFQKNKLFHAFIGCTPFQAVFGQSLKVDFAGSSLSKSFIDNLYDEDDLKRYVSQAESQLTINSLFSSHSVAQTQSHVDENTIEDIERASLSPITPDFERKSRRVEEKPTEKALKRAKLT